MIKSLDGVLATLGYSVSTSSVESGQIDQSLPADLGAIEWSIG